MRLVALLASVAAACIWTGLASAAPTRAEFIREGDVVCTQVKRELLPLRMRAQAAKLLPESGKWAATARIWADQIRIQRRFVARFKAIGTPANDKAARQLVGGLARGVPLAVRVQTGFAQRNTTALSTALPAYLNHTLTLNRRVAAYGFRACGR